MYLQLSICSHIKKTHLAENVSFNGVLLNTWPSHWCFKFNFQANSAQSASSVLFQTHY